MGRDLIRMRWRRLPVARTLAGFLLAAAALLGSAASAQAAPTETICVPARDGVCLAADLYLPAEPGRHPVLLQFTPYNRTGATNTAEHYRSRGYAVVVASSRGIYGSTGTWTPYVNDGRDAYDTQQWIGRQPWSNGRIGMFGCSYPGFTQLLSAPYRSRYLKAILPECAQSDNFGAIWSTDGIYQLALGPGWGTNQQAIAEGAPRPQLDWSQLMWHLPLGTLVDEVERLSGIRSEFVEGTIEHDTHDGFWERMSVRHLYDEMDVPAFHTVGWYDDLTRETFRNFLSMRESSRSRHARRWQTLLVGPWGHGANPRRLYGDVDFGPGVAIDVQAMRDRWFDYHVKRERNGLQREAPIKIFTMGANEWRDLWSWPPPGTREQRLYFRSDGEANSSAGDGALSTTPPRREPPDRYAYDPANPVRSHGGHACCPSVSFPIGPFDQKPTEDRQDVLVYTSDTLERDVEVTGRPEVNLSFSTDVTDTDFFVRLMDVRPDGKSIVIGEGALRTRFRNSLERPRLLRPNKVYDVKIPMWETSNVFKAGHRIRVHVTSSNFPRYNRNLNSGKALGDETAADLRVANQTIYHDAKRRSSIDLPVVGSRR